MRGSTSPGAGALPHYGDVLSPTDGEALQQIVQEAHPEEFRVFLGSSGSVEVEHQGGSRIVKACARWLNRGETPKHFPDLGDIATVTYEDTLRDKKPSGLLMDEEFEDLCGVLSKRDEVIVRLIRATGCRPSEVLNLERDGVVWEREDGQEVCMLSVTDSKTGEPWPPIVFDHRQPICCGNICC